VAKRKVSGILTGGLGVVDEIFAPTRYETQLERDRETILPAPAPIPGDGDLGIYDGRVRIDLRATDSARADR
jgi:hypothetical protein